MKNTQSSMPLYRQILTTAVWFGCLVTVPLAQAKELQQTASSGVTKSPPQHKVTQKKSIPAHSDNKHTNKPNSSSAGKNAGGHGKPTTSIGLHKTPPISNKKEQHKQSTAQSVEGKHSATARVASSKPSQRSVSSVSSTATSKGSLTTENKAKGSSTLNAQKEAQKIVRSDSKPDLSNTSVNAASASSHSIGDLAKPDPIYVINQHFAKLPLKYCPAMTNGYGVEINYPATDDAPELKPVISKVYGNAYLSGLKEGMQINTLNGIPVRTLADFNNVAYQGKARQASNLLNTMALGVQQYDVVKTISVTRGDYCLSNLTIEPNRDVIRMDFNTKGSGYSATADARVYVDPVFLDGLIQADWLTLASVAAAEQYRHGIRVKRGKVGLFAGQVFGTVVTLFTGVPITDLAASGATAVGSKDYNEGALRPSVTYGYYLGVTPNELRASLEKLSGLRDRYRVKGKRYDWPIPDDLSELTQAQTDLEALIAKNAEDLMLSSKTKIDKEGRAMAKSLEPINAPASESDAGVGNY